ncbi:ribosomal large subunit pseudouridine synthase B [Bacteroides fragilis]|nr:ribosomal large subunit pseudouridine synthase B [Bacteroides fragilis]MCE8606028.1 ribosomal large subunit pseudouridine synthase B [Bacteroides fragilis]MCE8609976.1 ribosomal large subunit pseudouridine synthase B [Bacteroides fragilis]MCE8666072.1 ribosomal large subunit pseudouridine synthase B [Bacteroides fragilis]MCE8669218.1 ribosomal large subunit pseudouridine synthase B [Bacteroides fragilis]
MNATAMTYSTSQINRDFRIKVYGYNNSDERLNLLVGVSGLIRLVGEELADTLVKRAFKNSYFVQNGKVVCKLRRGLKITFYQK